MVDPADRPVIAYSAGRASTNPPAIGTDQDGRTFVERAFITLMRRAGLRVIEVSNPAMFKNIASFRGLIGADPARVLFFSYRTSADIRPMAGAYNVLFFTWAFPDLRDHGLVTDAIADNQVAMLRLMDEIWVACAYTESVLRRYGLGQVHRIHPPVAAENSPERLTFAAALAVLGRLPAIAWRLSTGASAAQNAALAFAATQPLAAHPALARPGDGRIFVTVCDPTDLTRNLLNIIEGFQIASNGAAADVLIVKLVIADEDGDFRNQAQYRHLLPLCQGGLAGWDDRVIFIVDALPDTLMTALLCLADFYVSAAHCDGLDLALLRAMALGIAVIAPANTCMADYISPDSAVVIGERSFPGVLSGLAGDAAGTIYPISASGRFDIARAIRAAMALSPAQRGDLGARGKSNVDRLFAPQASLAAIEQRIAAVFGSGADRNG